MHQKSNIHNGQVVWVTGSARGIGLGIVKVFLDRGANVVVSDIDSEKIEQAVSSLGHQDRVLGVKCDVTSPIEVDMCLRQIVDYFGGLNVLVNNAGICPFIHAMELTPESWRKTMDVNLDAAFYCSQAAAKQMIVQGRGGRLVFITSLAENVTGPQQVDYGASKAGMRMLMVGMATALGEHNITCNAIAPGMLATEMTRAYYDIEENRKHVENRVPLKRLGTPEDIGRVAAFLASDDASYISGVSIRVDGAHQCVCV